MSIDEECPAVSSLARVDEIVVEVVEAKDAVGLVFPDMSSARISSSSTV